MLFFDRSIGKAVPLAMRQIGIAVVSAGARIFVLRGKGATRLHMLRVLMVAWDRMQATIETETSPAWIYEIDAAGRLKRIVP